jgi:hypothetical protein
VAEQTLVIAVDYLPLGQDVQWMPELNIVLIRDSLTEQEAQDALIDGAAAWRRQWVKLVLPAAS